jgi:hypothetical protein
VTGEYVGPLKRSGTGQQRTRVVVTTTYVVKHDDPKGLADAMKDLRGSATVSVHCSRYSVDPVRNSTRVWLAKEDEQ